MFGAAFIVRGQPVWVGATFIVWVAFIVVGSLFGRSGLFGGGRTQWVGAAFLGGATFMGGVGLYGDVAFMGGGSLWAREGPQRQDQSCEGAFLVEGGLYGQGGRFDRGWPLWSRAAFTVGIGLWA